MEVRHGKSHNCFRSSADCTWTRRFLRHREHSLLPRSFPRGSVLRLALAASAISPSESRRKLIMHINVTIGLLGLIGAAAEVGRSYASAIAKGLAPDPIALAAKLAMAGLLLIYVILCVRSFIQVRRSR